MNSSTIYDQIGHWPLGPVPIICSLAAIAAMVRLFLHPKGWRSRKGSVMLGEYGMAGICSLVILFFLARIINSGDVDHHTPITYLVAIISFVILAELIDRLLKFGLGASPIAEVTYKRFLSNPPDTNLYAALGGWVGVLIFTALFLFFPVREFPANAPPSRLDFWIGSHEYLYGEGWVFAMMGMMVHMVLWSTIRQIRGKQYG